MTCRPGRVTVGHSIGEGLLLTVGRAATAALGLLVGLVGLTPPSAHAGPAPTPTVAVTPAADVVDAQAVTVDGAGWEPGATVIVRQCRVGAEQCGWVIGVGDVGADGTFSEAVRVRTLFQRERGGATDCRAVACELRATEEESGTKVTATASTTFDPTAPLSPPPTLTVSPASGIRDGDRVTVDGSQFFFVSDSVFVQCAAGTTNVGVGICSPVEGRADPDIDGTFTIDLQVRAVIGQDENTIDCRVDACELLSSMFPYTSVVSRGSLGFDPDAPLGPPPPPIGAPTPAASPVAVTPQFTG